MRASCNHRATALPATSCEPPVACLGTAQLVGLNTSRTEMTLQAHEDSNVL